MLRCRSELIYGRKKAVSNGEYATVLDHAEHDGGDES